VITTQSATHHLVDTKDGTNVDTGVNVGTTIERVEHDTVVALHSLVFSSVTTLANEHSLFLSKIDQKSSSSLTKTRLTRSSVTKTAHFPDALSALTMI
jgi:hypothetical protein